MSDVTDSIREYLRQEGILMGAAKAEDLNSKAPEGFRPKDMMPGAKSVIVFAKALPPAVFLTPEGNNSCYQRTAYMYYHLMDRVAITNGKHHD